MDYLDNLCNPLSVAWEKLNIVKEVDVFLYNKIIEIKGYPDDNF